MKSPPLAESGSVNPTPRNTYWRVSRSILAKRDRRFWMSVIGIAIVVALVTAVFSFTELDWTDVHSALQRLPATLAIALMAILPIGGFSVAVVYLVAGAKFGPLLGGVVVAGITAVHLIGSYWIAHSFLRGPIERFMTRRRHALPKVADNAYTSVAVMTSLVPGLPYFARNYLLPLSGIPLRRYFWICLPIHVARSYVTLFLGDLSAEPDLQRLLILGAVLVVKLTICALIFARLRHRHWRADSPGQPAV